MKYVGYFHFLGRERAKSIIRCHIVTAVSTSSLCNTITHKKQTFIHYSYVGIEWIFLLSYKDCI